MEITIYQTAAELGKAAGTATAALIREEIKKTGGQILYWRQEPANLKR